MGDLGFGDSDESVMFFRSSRRDAGIDPDAAAEEFPGESLPVFFDPTSRRRTLLRILGTVAILAFLVWSGFFGLSLYTLTKLSAVGSYPAIPAGETARRPDPAVPAEEFRPSAVPPMTVYAYLPFHPEWSYFPLAKALPRIDVLLPEWYRFDFAAAKLAPIGFEEGHQVAIAELLHDTPAVKLMPVADIDDETQPSAVASALTTTSAVDALARSIAATAADRNYAGLCLDLSGIPPSAYDGAARLFAALQALYRGTARQTCLVAPLDSALWDQVPLRRAVDRAVVLGFRDPKAMAQPGAPAPQDWFTTRLAAVMAGFDPGKVVLALGAAGSDWVDGDPVPRDIAYAEAMRLAGLHDAEVRFDPVARNTSFAYFDGVRRHEVWLLDAASAYNELAALRVPRPGGIAVWPLTGADPAIWRLLRLHPPLADPVSVFRDVDIGDYIGYEGAGAFHKLLRAPHPGQRSVATDPASGAVVDVAYGPLPEPYTILRYGAGRKGTVALTFDDGPDADYTESILKILKRYDVPATFFIVGKNALRDPALVADMAEQGHAVGVHTFFHPVLERATSWRIRFEVNATERLIASITGRRTLMFRSPYGTGRGPLAGSEEWPMRQVEEYGYVVVGADVTPRDWTGTTAASLTASIRAGLRPDSGNVVQLHDGGGDRSATVAALPLVIETLRRDGYSFVPLASFLGKTDADLMPRDDSPTATFDALSFAAIRLAAEPFLWIFWAVTLLGIGRALLVLVLAHRRRPHAVAPGGDTPPVTVVVPAFCEETVIAATLAAVLDSDYPALRVIVVDDGSTDRTAAVVTEAYGADPRVTLIVQPNSGKSNALNHAYRQIETGIVVAIDADTVIHPEAIRRLVAHFRDPTIGAVAGNVKVSNRGSLLALLQSLEYITSQNIDRRAAETYNGILVVPGAISAWRRDAVAKAGYYSPQTLAEDADLTVSVIRAGYRIIFEETALAATEAPETVRQFMRQRLRWILGVLQTAWKHRGAVAERRGIGLISIPELFLFGMVLSVFAPVADVMALAALVNGVIDAVLLPGRGWSAHSLVVLGAYAVFLLTDLMVGVLAFRLEPAEDKRQLLLLPLQRFFYRQLLYVTTARAIHAAVTGRLMKWRKVTRSLAAAPSRESRAARRRIQLRSR